MSRKVLRGATPEESERLRTASSSHYYRQPVEDADALYTEYAAQGVEFTRGLGNTPWRERGFVVKDCDCRLLAFGANL